MLISCLLLLWRELRTTELFEKAFAFSLVRKALRKLIYASADYQLLVSQNNPYVKVVYFGVASSPSITNHPQIQWFYITNNSLFCEFAGQFSCWFHLSSFMQLLSAGPLAGMQASPLITSSSWFWLSVGAPWFSASNSNRIDQLPCVIVSLKHSERIIVEPTRSLSLNLLLAQSHFHCIY